MKIQPRQAVITPGYSSVWNGGRRELACLCLETGLH